MAAVAASAIGLVGAFIVCRAAEGRAVKSRRLTIESSQKGVE